MKITKFGHCCLLIEDRGLRILTDPGAYTTAQNNIKGIDVVLITHEHIDHFHIDSVKKVLENNPDTKIVTNSAVNALLEKENIFNSQIVEDGQKFEYKDVLFRGFGTEHEEIYKERGKVMNTGYMIAEKLYYPGDSFFVPDLKVDVLAMPVGGGWCRIRDAIDFALKIQPQVAFPVHDIMYNEIGIAITKRHPQDVLKENGIEFISLEIGKEYEF